jgi:phosphatidylserine decarboxylase
LDFLQSAEFQSHPLAYNLLSFLADGKEGLANMIDDRYSLADTLSERTRTGVGVFCTNEEYKSRKDMLMLNVMDRTTGLIVSENIPRYVKVALNLLYSKRSRVFTVRTKSIHRILKFMSRREGQRMDDPASVAHIRPFISFHKLNSAEWLLPVDDENRNYKCFNHFFYRKLKPTARTIGSPNDNRIVVSCADCRMTVFETVKEATAIWVKGAGFTITQLLGPHLSDVAPLFHEGSLVIARLAPQDYHRWHMPVFVTLTYSS